MSSAPSWPIHPEEFVIDELLKSSEEFQHFYHDERPKIVFPVLWAQDASLPVGIDYRTTLLTSGEHFVRLLHIPARIQDACKIAHELEHFVLESEGFPMLGPVSDQYELLSSSIGSVVADLLVNSRLQKFGFDLRADYESEITESKRQIENNPVPPTNRYEQMIWMANSASHLLDWEFILSNRDKSEFQTWFERKHPGIAARSAKLAAMVKRIGFDTPGKQAKLFREIIRRYKLDDVLLIR